jgi:hypothetical protein
MAIDQNAYSPKEFQFLIGGQAAWNTQLLTALYALDVDSVGFPSFGTNQVLDTRSGGRVLYASDLFQTQAAQVTEISVSGTVKADTMSLLLANITNDNSGTYAVAGNYEPPALGSGTTGLTAADFKLMTIVYSSPLTDSDLVFEDCVCTALTLNGDMGTEAGRVKFTATFKTGTKPHNLSLASEAVDTAIGTGDVTMTGWGDDTYRKICGVNQLVVNSFSLNLENDAIFTGIDSNGNFEAVTRASEFVATADFNIKYDVRSEPMINSWQTQTGDSGVTLMNPDGSLDDGTFGFAFNKSAYTNCAWAEGDVMNLDVSVKALGNRASLSDAIVEIAI